MGKTDMVSEIYTQRQDRYQKDEKQKGLPQGIGEQHLLCRIRSLPNLGLGFEAADLGLESASAAVVLPSCSNSYLHSEIA